MEFHSNEPPQRHFTSRTYTQKRFLVLDQLGFNLLHATLSCSCCDMSIEKIEVVMNKECRGEVKSITVNGQAQSVSYAGNEYPSSVYPQSQMAEYQIVKVCV